MKKAAILKLEGRLNALITEIDNAEYSWSDGQLEQAHARKQAFIDVVNYIQSHHFRLGRFDTALNVFLSTNK